jgi:hypothetical protein
MQGGTCGLYTSFYSSLSMTLRQTDMPLHCLSNVNIVFPLSHLVAC